MLKDWDLWLCIIVYTITFFWFGMWVQKKYDQFQLKQFEDSAWSDGCRQCAQFEKNQCERDNTLQGVKEPHKIDENNHSGVKEGAGDDAAVDGSDSTVRDSHNGGR